ncbi:MAG: DUF3524 domain-containing protein [Nitrospirae bacterium]|nr:DUF3524 domain-containing protein [Nitrospirota bacterium]
MPASQEKRLKVLVLEPYYGGSHRSFLNNISNLNFDFEIMTLSARKWKWRMRLAAPYFAEKLHKSDRKYDRILCSSFLDVASFRGMAPSWVRDVPLLTYFHENQFEYPVQVDDERDIHFGLTNLTTALSSDGIGFNSEYNLSTFLKGADDLLKIAPGMKLNDPLKSIRGKSRVISAGIDFSDIDSSAEEGRSGIPVILWNHRWEHDKCPEIFFKALYELDKEGIDFRLVILGESFQRSPNIFNEAKGILPHRILHSGYVDSRQDYCRWLKMCDIVVSTAAHEFFGISVLEAVRAGCRPLLPNRLSYPEIFPEEFLYGEKDLVKRLRGLVLKKKRLSAEESKRITEPHSWARLAHDYEEWLTFRRQ